MKLNDLREAGQEGWEPTVNAASWRELKTAILQIIQVHNVYATDWPNPILLHNGEEFGEVAYDLSVRDIGGEGDLSPEDWEKHLAAPWETLPSEGGRTIAELLNDRARRKGFDAEWWGTGGSSAAIGVCPEGTHCEGPHLLITFGDNCQGVVDYSSEDFDDLSSWGSDWDNFAVGFYREAIGCGPEESLTYIKGIEGLEHFVTDWMDDLGFSNGALRRAD